MCPKFLRKWVRSLPVFCLAWTVAAVSAEPTDSHYTPAGFFDIHVCNWPDRPPFFMALVSTGRYGEVAQVTIRMPSGGVLGRLDLTKFRRVRKDGRPERRVFITQFALPPRARNGWYEAEIVLRNGARHVAKDFVIVQSMDRAQPIYPPDEAVVATPPAELRWSSVAGARYYKVHIRDLWADGKVVYESTMLSQPMLAIPNGVLEPGGWYSWRVHARDVDGHLLLGDFNHGSLSEDAVFTVGDAHEAPP